MKVRVEVEARGVLKVSDKKVEVLTRYRYYDRHNDAKEVPEAETSTRGSGPGGAPR